MALRALGFATTHVGSSDPGVPPRGSTDEDVLRFARRTKQVIVTSNHDMMLICAEAKQRFVWIDPRGRQYTRVEQVLIVFSQIERWQHLLDTNPGWCIRSLRTRCDVVDPREAARLAEQRMRALRRRRRSRPTPPSGPLFTVES